MSRLPNVSVARELEVGLFAGEASTPAPPALTRLVRVRRDGNPHRAYGLASPYLGKLAPLDRGALVEAARTMTALVPAGTEPLWVVGLTESSLIPAWCLSSFLPAPAALGLSSRERPSRGDVRSFDEPHSHGRHHHLVVPSDGGARRIVVVEDELTTGATLRNLLVAVRDVARAVTVVVLSDHRTADARAWFRAEMARHGVEVTVCDLSATMGRPGYAGHPAAAPPRPEIVPRAEGARLPELVAELERDWRRRPPDVVFAVGECVDVPLTLWWGAGGSARPPFRHVTRSPWCVDGGAIRSRRRLGRRDDRPPYFLYNQPPPAAGAAAWIFAHPAAEYAATELAAWWEGSGGRARAITVPRP